MAWIVQCRMLFRSLLDDVADRRTNETWSTGREMAYGYDASHQLTGVGASRPSDAARYAYDPAGNPVERAELGFEVTNAFNNLNQIFSGSWTGSTITAVGAVNYPAGTVSVSGASGTIYADKTFDAAGVPVHLGVNYLTNVFIDVFGRSVTNATSVTIANRTYAHDANGNLTSDGVFGYAYDAANQLTNVVRLADGARVLSARYDALGRRVEAIRGDGSVERYVYFPGSFLVLAVLDETNAPKEFYTRGPDLSGSLDGAGGIGGLLAVMDSSSVVRYSHADIMGNVIALTDASGSVAATFRYTPFGQLSARTGSVLPRYLFSSKEFDRAANLYYYGYRYYAPRLGRWMTRDPTGEASGICLYQYDKNSVANFTDAWGLKENFASMFLHYIFRTGQDGFTGYSDNIWRRVLSSREVINFVSIGIPSMARRKAFCCTTDDMPLGPMPLITHLPLANYYNPLNWGVGLAIGSGWLDIDKSSIQIVCNDVSCQWSANVIYILLDRYSFEKYDSAMKPFESEPDEMITHNGGDNNTHFRFLKFFGKNFDVRDSKTVFYTGEIPCQKESE